MCGIWGWDNHPVNMKVTTPSERKLKLCEKVKITYKPKEHTVCFESDVFKYEGDNYKDDDYKVLVVMKY